jgi:hypothetical protein
MSRIIQVNDSDYKVKVRSNGQNDSNGTVTLDVGTDGKVIVTGNLTVFGETTTVASTVVAITDPTFVINNQVRYPDNAPGQQEAFGNGINTPTGEAGIIIGRGIHPDGNAEIFFSESLYWYDNQTNSTKQGAFVFKTANTLLAGIRTNSITTNDKDQNLNLLGPSPNPDETGFGTAILTVHGVSDYADRINNKILVDEDQQAFDEAIPNVAWVNGAIATYFDATPPAFIQRGDTTLRVYDTSESDVESKLDLKINGVVNTTFKIDEFTVQDFRFSNGTIETLTLANDLILRSSGTGTVTIDDTLKINLVDEDPTQAGGSVKIYTKDETYGGTGIYFVNNQDTRDELVSRRKALAYSMIF